MNVQTNTEHRHLLALESVPVFGRLLRVDGLFFCANALINRTCVAVYLCAAAAAAAAAAARCTMKVIFAVGRTPGWVSQWKEGLAEPGRRIYRPRQLYTGHTARAFVPISEREDDDSTVAAPAARL